MCLQAANYGDVRNLDGSHTKTTFTPRPFRTLAEWNAQRAKLRRQVMTAAGLTPMPEKTPLRARRFDRREFPEFAVEKVTLEPLPGLFLAGNLYLPRQRRGSAAGILVPHGHWKNGRTHHAGDYSVPALCVNLAARGFVAFAYDMIGYGDTHQLPHHFGDSPEEQAWSFHPLGLQLWNGIRSLDFLESLPEVDRRRLGVTGASGGGTHTFLLAGVDDRVRASAPVNMISAHFQGDDDCEMAPGLRVDTNNLEIAALAAPNPMLIISSTKDWTKNTPRVEFPAIRSIYRLFGRADAVRNRHVDAEHNYNRESRQAAYGFFQEVLQRRMRVDAEERVGLPFEPESLRIGEAEMPKGESAKEILARWKAMALKQAQESDVEKLRDTLRQIIGAEWPTGVDALPVGERLVLVRQGSGERVPARWMPGSGPQTAVVVHGRPEEETSAGQVNMLMLHVYQKGPAAADRAGPRGDHLVFHRSDDARRVQDILTGLAYAGRQAHLVCDRAAVGWCMAAVALAPYPIVLSAPDAEVPPLQIPGLQRAGGWAAIQRAARRY